MLSERAGACNFACWASEGFATTLRCCLLFDRKKWTVLERSNYYNGFIVCTETKLLKGGHLLHLLCLSFKMFIEHLNSSIDPQIHNQITFSHFSKNFQNTHPLYQLIFYPFGSWPWLNYLKVKTTSYNHGEVQASHSSCLSITPKNYKKSLIFDPCSNFQSGS